MDVLSQSVLKNKKSELQILFWENILNISYISQFTEKKPPICHISLLYYISTVYFLQNYIW